MLARALLCTLVACSAKAPAPADDRRAPAPPAAAPDGPTCADAAALDAHRDAPCTIRGRYTLQRFPGKGGRELGPWPVVTLADGTAVMIGSLWKPEERPDDTRYLDRLVVATGVVRTSPPRDMPANFGHWTLSPVTAIAIAE